MNTDNTAGRVFPSRAAYEEAKRHRESVMNPPKPQPKVEAVKVLKGGRLFAGKRREEGAILLVFPDTIPDPFISKEAAKELLENGHAAPATPEEIEAYLAANETPSTEDK